MATAAILVLSLFLAFASTEAFNITRLLSQYSDFSNFNDYLTQTKLADSINRRQTITVLAVDNGAVSSLSGKSPDLIKKVLSLHVILDYYDIDKIKKLSNKSTILTTLFQSTGVAVNKQGFLNVTRFASGEVRFGSAVKGSSLDAQLIKKVAAQPYNLSVLQVSSVIYPTGIEDIKFTPTPPPPRANAPRKSLSPAKAPAPASDSPSDAKAPVEGPSRDADTPASSPPSPVADGPAGDSTGDADAPGPEGPSASSATRVAFSAFFALAMGFFSSWAEF
ncbi:PREDICTED: fasciclin-like arabinogalactan protein 14 [Nelumbo nucifera]|uniref:Fasciclin-like arabinogalactan protein 14 n=1 Tax=Nelumbo nucifera TaxID=4432 RepID=A0A1U8AR77_NELNU|nr:PREDICTED: fasciclin-like arabinogalactan protein 14 [Nelumbo nucifera]